MKKLESLTSSKFEKFADSTIDNLDKIIGGWIQTMSWDTANSPADKAALTDKNGHSYDGNPGDGTAGDWKRRNGTMVQPGELGDPCSVTGEEGGPPPPSGTPLMYMHAIIGNLQAMIVP